MKKRNLLLFVISVLVFSLIGCSNDTADPVQQTEPEVTEEPVVETVTLPQLSSDDREDAASMVLQGAPPMQPDDHIDRWNPELRYESCTACHGNEATGAPTPPADHYVDDKIGNPIYRDNCIQCHATQNDTKPAFNQP
ncbi:nitrate reductase cytochrome c-type subunit [Cytobacillus sp. Hm23]|uniref:nitrate reductase cytochrome c-type subunit n=1 Tax=Nanhaiella sioensis TaxID=3115293 RepID=UPI003979D104